MTMGMAAGACAKVTLEDLRCEFMVDPLGINAEAPRLSWKLKSDAQNEMQTAFEVLAATSEALLTPEEADLYSSGKIEGDWSHLFPYIGKRPDGMKRVFWKVRVWDNAGEASEWSPTAMWSYGPEQESDWKNSLWVGVNPEDMGFKKEGSKDTFYKTAKWIWTEEARKDQPSSVAKGERYFRKVFTLPTDKAIQSVVGVATADDSYRFYLNGKGAADGYNWREVSVFDLKEFVKPGENTIHVSAENSSDGYAGLVALVEVVFEDGSTQLISTDDSWQSTKTRPEGWGSAQVSAEGWAPTVVQGAIGISPWGKPGEDSGLPNLPALLFRKEFTLNPDKPVKSALAHISGMGLFELYFNGAKIGDHVLDPMATDYTKTVAYQTFDIKQNLNRKQNVLGVMLGNGRFTNPRVGKHYGPPMTRVLVRVEYEDGTIQEVVSDESWVATDKGPIRFNNEFDGETYDARMELNGWNDLNFKPEGWFQAVKISEEELPTGKLKAQMMPPIRVTEVLTPKSVTQTGEGTFMVDMGQNLVGWCRIKAKGDAGTEIKLVHAETLKKDGTLYMDNLRSARVTDRYIMKGQGVETYEPRFIYHGFRFVEVSGYPGTLTPENILGCVVHDDLDVIGQFETSHPLVNRIYHNIFWGVRGNYRSMPTDCPQRDERLGWLGDRAAESLGESMIFNIAPLYSKWLRDMSDSQRENGSLSVVSPNYWAFYHDDVTWPSASIIIPEALYNQYGDIGIVAEHYPSMKKWMDHMQQYVKDGIIERDTYGDWCCPPESPELIHSNDPLRKTAPGVLASTYFYGNLRLMEKYARLIDKGNDAKVWAQRAEEMKAAFIKKFYNADKKCFDNGSQTSSVLPLFFGMVPQGEEQAVFEQLIDKIMVHTKGHIGTGLIGAQYLNRVLSDYGRSDISWRLVTNTDYPSWGYMVKNGATTVWELWNGDTANPGMNSHNHVMLIGDLNVWFYERLAGMRSVAPGYKKILFKPEPIAGVDYVKASLETPYGKAASSWKVEGKKFTWNIEVPANTTATVVSPDGKSIELGSGKYTIESSLP